MNIMSGSEEKTPTVSPDQGATGETTPSSENKEAHYKEEYNNAVFKLLKNISMQNPELGRDIVMESLLKHFAMEIRSKRSEKPDFLDLDKLEALSSEHLETSGHVPDWLKKDMEYAREDVEFETYLTLLKEVRAHGGHNMELITGQYILKHKGEAYYQNLCMSCYHKEK